MADIPPPLPVSRRGFLLRGPLILTAISRVLTIPFYLFCAVRSSNVLRSYCQRLSYYDRTYLVDQIALVATMWTFLLLSVLLAILFFSRHRMFRPVMIYFSLLPWLLFVGLVIHTEHFKPPHRTPPRNESSATWIGCSVLAAMAVWPFYYGFSPRVKRVFAR